MSRSFSQKFYIEPRSKDLRLRFASFERGRRVAADGNIAGKVPTPVMIDAAAEAAYASNSDLVAGISIVQSAAPEGIKYDIDECFKKSNCGGLLPVDVYESPDFRFIGAVIVASGWTESFDKFARSSGTLHAIWSNLSAAFNFGSQETGRFRSAATITLDSFRTCYAGRTVQPTPAIPTLLPTTPRRDVETGSRYRLLVHLLAR